MKTKETTNEIIKKFCISTKFLIIDTCDPISRRMLFQWEKDFFIFFLKMERTIGLRSTVSYFKELRQCFTRYLSGNKHTPSEYRFRIGVTNDGIPKIMGVMIPKLREGINPSELRVIMTYMTFGRLIELQEQNIDVCSITTPPKVNNVIDIADFKRYVKKTVTFYSGETPLKSFVHYPVMLGQGPNGPAMRASIAEARHIPSQAYEWFAALAPGLEKRLKDLLTYLPDHQEDWNKRFNLTEVTNFRWGKISRIPDKEGKTRVIATLNYWAQSSLKPLHDSCEAILKSLPWDYTFSQGGFTENTYLQDDNVYHSIDLKDATDRFPRFLQEAVIESLYGSEVSGAWENIMSQEFSDTRRNTTVRYAAGQPMGSYSSWPVFALTHGLLVSYIESKVGNKHSNEFFILGDDIVILNNSVANKYKEILQSLGVELSISKTLSSKYLFEFAKRWFYKGVEISPFPINALHESLTFPPGLVETFRSALVKGWDITSGGDRPELLKHIIKAHGYHPTFVKKIIHEYMLCASLPRSNETKEHRFEKLVRLHKLCGSQVSCGAWLEQVTCNTPNFVRNAIELVLEDNLHKVLKVFNIPEEFDINLDEGDSPGDPEKYVNQAAVNNQTANPDERSSSSQCMPLLEVIKVSRQRMLEMIGDVGESMNRKNHQSVWEVLETSLKESPVLSVLSSNELSKERSQTRILKVKRKVIKHLVRLITSHDAERLRALQD